jgi:hypothetical protein
MKNPCLEAALQELDAAGIRDVERAYGGKHLQLRWQVNGERRMHSMPATPSDLRSAANTRAQIRQKLRADGRLVDPSSRPGKIKPPSVQEQLRELRVEIRNLRERIVKLETGDNDSEEQEVAPRSNGNIEPAVTSAQWDPLG